MSKDKKMNIRSLRELLLVGVVILLGIVWTIMNPQFLSANNISNILRQASYTAIAAVGMTMVIIIGEIDLSAGSLVCASGLVGAVICKNTDSVLLAVLGAVMVGVVVGAANGILCAVGKLPGFIASLASMTILRGLAYIATGGNSIVWRNEQFTMIGTGYIGVIPVPVLIMIIVIIFGIILTTKTRFGRYIYAVGGNIEASRWSGIAVTKVKILVYVIMGILTSIAGLIITARLGSGQPSAGTSFEMDCITAAVVGGTSMAGGRGKVLGTVVGVLLLTVLTNGMTLVGMNTYWQQVLKGVIIVVSVLVDTRGKK
ncbi:ABC transporter permease [Faecalicatena contorta]|uniref:Monosaccharide ABC transporter membrane protein, CUT2 family n=1 Tax=Faecalicatena contorta TaxID=39482 RepID=A0A315ZTV4_9FIRM|nr:ribose ABC transporter permease [Faecalicatena contorta]MBA4700647.1 ribose ABC transporter permease [Ruminococcus sp.]PWJ48986.1 monosaccharide ABC transporter membrane protein (CUT2 family) [Faecalicatena contorta]SUQ15076.1 monosaccharide ABC transporter membrane protein, CUT2 family [Faecalicatena contorta]